MVLCNQNCGKPAIKSFNGNPLCVDCYTKISSAHQNEQDQLRRMINSCQSKMAMITGLPDFFPQYDLPTQNLYQNNVTNNHIKNTGVIGVLNTGNIGCIEKALDYHVQNENTNLADAIKQLTEAVVNSTEITLDVKNEIVEQLSVLAIQSTLPLGENNKGVTKAILAYIPNLINTSSNLIQLWEKFRPIIEPYL